MCTGSIMGVSTAGHDCLCFVCLQYKYVLSDLVALSLYEKLINWLFSHRERSPQLPLHLSLSLLELGPNPFCHLS